jgi:hypothetical protein
MFTPSAMIAETRPMLRIASARFQLEHARAYDRRGDQANSRAMRLR